ncbi:MAG TPA: hypothetical protein VHS31_02120 [Tepidisphaeraceae bacterium]|nr:hypothetical protein [Tepidisphaeraceae bacterium]
MPFLYVLLWGFFQLNRIYSSQPAKPIHAVWDFSKKQDLAIVGWPKENSLEFWYPGEIDDLRIILPDGTSEEFRRAKPLVKRRGSRVVLVGINTPQPSIESTIHFADFWCHRRNVTQMNGSLSELQERVSKDPNYPRVVTESWYGSGDRLSIEIVPHNPFVVELSFSVAP